MRGWAAWLLAQVKRRDERMQLHVETVEVRERTAATQRLRAVQETHDAALAAKEDELQRMHEQLHATREQHRSRNVQVFLRPPPTQTRNTVRSFATHGQLSAAKGSSTTVSRSGIRLIQHLDSSALGLVRRWLLIGGFPSSTHYPPHTCVGQHASTPLREDELAHPAGTQRII
jgi:hypothetical protein